MSDEAGDPVTLGTLTALQTAVQTSRLVATLDDGSQAVAVSSDGSLLATDSLAADGSPSSDVLVLEPATGERLRTLSGPSDVGAILFSPTGTLLAVTHPGDSVGDQGSIAVWDAATGEQVVRLTAPDYWPSPLWSPDGALLVAIGLEGNEDPLVIVWRSPSMTEVSSFQLSGRVTSARFLDRTTVAVARPGADRVGFYDVTTGDEVEALEIPDIPFDNASQELGIDPVGRRLLLMGSETQVWDLESKSLLWSAQADEIAEMDPDRGWVALYDRFGIRVLDLDDGSEVMRLTRRTGGNEDVVFDPHPRQAVQRRHRWGDSGVGHNPCRPDRCRSRSHCVGTSLVSVPRARRDGGVARWGRNGHHHGWRHDHPLRLRHRSNLGVGRRVGRTGFFRLR